MFTLKRKIFACISVLAITMLALFTQPIAPAFAAATSIYPGTAWTDTGGTVIQAHGGGMIKVGSTYYWFGEDKTNGSNFQNVKCYSSTDLKSWTFVNNVLTLQASGDLGPNRIVERPHVIYNAATSMYVMWMHIDSTSYGDRKAGTAKSSTVCGNYTYLGSVKPLGHDSLDDDLFVDGATGYFMSEDRSNGKLQLYQLSADYLTIANLKATLNQYEGPALAKVGSTYYMFGSYLTGWNTNDNQYSTATSLAGPWSAWKSFAPSGSNTCNSQTTNIVPIAGSGGTTYMFMGDRWNPNDLSVSRYIWQPLTINGTTATIDCRAAWTVDTSTGLWSDISAASYEAESYANTFAGASVVQGLSGGSQGRGVGWIGNGSGNTLRFNNLNVPTAGNYDVLIHYANGDASARTASISVNGGGGTSYTFPSTYSSSMIGAIKATVSLNAGNNTLLFSNSSAYAPDLDRVVIVGGTAQAPLAGVYYRLINRNSGKVAAVSGASTANGGDIIQWTSNGGLEQQWQLQYVGGYFRIVNRKSGKLAAVSGGSTSDGGDIIQWQSTGGWEQDWILSNLGSGYYAITNRNSGKEFDVSGASTADGANILQWTWSGGNNQQWQIVP